MKPLPKNISGMVLILSIVGIMFAVATNTNHSADIIGRALATLVDLKFVFLVLAATILVRQVNILILSAAIAFVYELLLQLTLQDHWSRFGVQHNIAMTIVIGFFVALIVLSLAHLLLGKNEVKTGEIK